MKKSTKVWLITAAALTIIGAVVFVGALFTCDFDFKKFLAEEFKTVTYKLDDNFDNISVNVKNTTVILALSDDGTCKAEYFEKSKVKHSAEIQNGTLIITENDSRKWYDRIGINFNTPMVTVYLPKDVYTSLSVATETGNLVISKDLNFETVTATGTTSNIRCFSAVTKDIELKTTTGDIILTSDNVENIKLSATTGRIMVEKTKCNRLTAKNSTGIIKFERVIVKESLKAESTTGGVRFDRCDAAEIYVETTTGDVTGDLLSEKIFITETATGSVDVPKTANGGKCQITTSTGNIEIEIY